MSTNVQGMKWFAGTLRAWHLAILRYAVTLDNADRLAVLRIAREIDGLYPRQEGNADFEFFRRTSAELCAAIVHPDERASALLQQYLARIDDDRLKRTFAAAIDALGKPVGGGNNFPALAVNNHRADLDSRMRTAASADRPDRRFVADVVSRSCPAFRRRNDATGFPPGGREGPSDR